MTVATQDTTLHTIVNMIKGERLSELIQAYGGDRYCKSLSVQKMLIAMVIGILKGMKSLRDIEYFTEDCAEELREVGVDRIARSSLADRLKRTNPAILKGFFESLREEYEKRLSKPSKEEFKLLLMDSTMIEVPLSQVNWARYSRTKGAIKMHTILKHGPQEEHPVQMVLTDGKTADVTIAEQELEVDSDSIFVADRGYASKRLFNKIAKLNGTFVIRIKSKTYYHLVNTRIRTLGEDSPPLDEEVTLERRNIFDPRQLRFRRLVLPPFEGHKKPIVLLTNDFTRTAAEIGEIYRRRWRIELFFKWLKQHLHLSTLIGFSRNAVENQIYIALILALLLAYLHSLVQNARTLTPYTLFRHLRNRLFQRYNLIEALFGDLATPRPPIITPNPIQLYFSFI